MTHLHYGKRIIFLLFVKHSYPVRGQLLSVHKITNPEIQKSSSAFEIYLQNCFFEAYFIRFV